MKANDILDRASRAIGQRSEIHGGIVPTFSAIAALLTTYLRHRRDPDAPVSQSDAAKMMVLLKIARSENGALNPDDYVDMCGYAAIAGELEGMGL